MLTNPTFSKLHGWVKHFLLVANVIVVQDYDVRHLREDLWEVSSTARG